MVAWWRAFRRKPEQPRTEAPATAALNGETLRLLHEALHDPVTELPEPALLLDRLEVALVRARRAESGLALLVVHVETAAAVRARLGDAEFDDVLREIARRLRTTLRACDTASRYGDSDFAVLCEDLRRNEDLALVAGRIASALDPAYDVNGQPVGIRASLHLVLPEDGSTAVSLVEEMDAALRDAAA